MSDQQGANPTLNRDVIQSRGMDAQCRAMPNGSSKLIREKEVSGTFNLYIS